MKIIQIALVISALLAILFAYLLVLKTKFWFLLVLVIGFMVVSFIPTVSKKWFQSIKTAIFYGSSLGFLAGLLLGGFVRLFNA